SLGVSSRSVADWTRRWKRFLISSFSDSPNCSSLMPRYSSVFIAPVLVGQVFNLPLTSRQVRNLPYGNLHTRPAGYQPAAKGHLVSYPGQSIARGGFRQAADFKENHARLDHRRPVFRLAFALAHARFRGDGCHGLVR